MPDSHDVELVDDLLTRPFGNWEDQGEWDAGGPDHHLRALRVSRDFWGDYEVADWTRAEEEIHGAYLALVDALTVRWGPPGTLDLSRFWTDENAPEPFGQWSSSMGNMRVWPQTASGRWVGVAFGQADREFPMILYAAVGTVPLP